MIIHVCIKSYNNAHVIQVLAKINSSMSWLCASITVCDKCFTCWSWRSIHVYNIFGEQRHCECTCIHMFLMTCIFLKIYFTTKSSQILLEKEHNIVSDLSTPQKNKVYFLIRIYWFIGQCFKNYLKMSSCMKTPTQTFGGDNHGHLKTKGRLWVDTSLKICDLQNYT